MNSSVRPTVAPQPSVPLSGSFGVSAPLLDVLQESVVVVDDERHVVYANPAFVASIGLTSTEQVLGRRFGDLVGCAHAAQHPQGCGASVFCEVCGGLRAQQQALEGVSATEECRIVRSDSGALDLRIKATPIVEPGCRLALVTALDTSSLHRRRMLERIFFHDIRNTAGGVVGLSGFLAELTAADADPKRAELAGNVARLSHQLLEEINAQADLVAMEGGELRARPAPIDMADFLAEITALYARHPVAAGKHIEVDHDWSVASVLSDRLLLARVVGNLLKNALEACPPGAAVTLGTRAEADAIEVFVHNPGVIPQAVQLQVFQRSFSTKGAGRGLGTYSAQLIGERALGGSVGFASNEGSGTHFWIRLKPPDTGESV